MSSFGKEGEAAGKTSCGSFSSCHGCAVIKKWHRFYGMESYAGHGILHFVQDDKKELA